MGDSFSTCEWTKEHERELGIPEFQFPFCFDLVESTFTLWVSGFSSVK